MKQNILMGGTIYSFRVSCGMTQEQLAAKLCVSPAAVSKWERNLSYPNIEMLMALADIFDCSIDELAGRGTEKLTRFDGYEDNRLRLMEIAEVCLECAEASRQKGLLAMEEKVEQYRESRFLKFAVRFALQCFRKNMQPELIFTLLNNYADTLPTREQAEGKLITDSMQMIFSGETTELIREVIASHIGMDYWLHRIDWTKSKEEIMEKYVGKAVLVPQVTNLLEPLVHVTDFQIQMILRNLDSQTLAGALYGASGSVICRFLSNLSDRMMIFIFQDMENWTGTTEEILNAQRKILEVKARCFPDSIE